MIEGGYKMRRVNEVATYFLNLSLNDSRSGTNISHLKLQKLVYYAQGWFLAAFGEEMYKERIEAWPHGPVSPDLYQKYKKYGYQTIPHSYSEIDINCDRSESILNLVWSNYGTLDAKDLEKLTHSEDPWKNARKGLEPWEASNNVITLGAIETYFKKFTKTGAV